MALKKLLGYSWPGNVRELENVIERALVLAHGTRLGSEDITFGGNILADQGAEFASGSVADSVSPEPVAGVRGCRSLTERVAEVERTCIEEALRQSSANKSKAARLLGIPRTTLVTKMNMLGLAARHRKDN
jgi:DNA-binding NtrC family response regulator